MAVECHLCYEPLIQGQKALTLHCGHVCCGSCLDKWLQNSEQYDRRCPVCRYLPEVGEVPRPVFLRFAEGAAPRTRTLVNLDDAIKNGEGLKALVTGLSDAENLTAHELTTMLDDALNLHAAMQDLCRVRELQEIMSDVSAYLVAIKDDLPRYRDDLEGAERQLEEQKLVEDELQRKVEINEEQIRGLEAALNDQKQNYESKLEGSQVAIDKLRNEKEELEANYVADRKGLQDELASSELLIVELGVAVERIKSSIIGCKKKVAGGNSLTNEGPSVDAAFKDIPTMPHVATNSGTTSLLGQHSEDGIPNTANAVSYSMVSDTVNPPPTQPGPHLDSKAEIAGSLERPLPAIPIAKEPEQVPQPPKAPQPIHVIPIPPPSGPWTSLHKRLMVTAECAAAFLNYHNALVSTKTIEIQVSPPSPGNTWYQATADLGTRQASGKAKAALRAQQLCAQEIWSTLSKAEAAIWEQFVRSPRGQPFW